MNDTIYTVRTIENIVAAFGDGEEGVNALTCALRNCSEEDARLILSKRRELLASIKADEAQK